ncbi:response regulator [Marinicella sp. W31]|uniref:hybrid sensor histidine kinase/response regulator transcription factor n=1 Tax=Marinicella sp. W31 TaxID=3023713 RepID=UPI003757A789
MKKTLSRYLLLLILVLPYLSEAQFLELKSPFNKSIKTILQDSQGLLWVASSNAVASFDGYQFNVIPLDLDTSESAITVTDIAFINDYELLIATAKHGLLSYRLDKQRLSKPKDIVEERQIYDLEKTSDGMWIASKRGLYFMTDDDHEFYPFHEENLFINKIVHQEGAVILASIDRLISFNIKDNRFTDLQYPRSQRTVFFWDLHVKQNNNLLISTDQGVYEKNTLTDDWSLTDQNPAQCIGRVLATDENSLWIGTVTKGLVNNTHENNASKEDVKQFLTSNSNISSEHITAIYQDQDDNIWLGFYNGGISRFSRNSLAIRFNANGLNYSGCEKIGTTFGFTEDSKNQMWLASTKGAIAFDQASQSCKVVQVTTELPYRGQSTMPTVIFQDHAENIWAYYHSLGLVQLSDPDQVVSHIDFPINRREAILHDFVTQSSPNTFIFAANKGLVSYDIENKKLTPIETKSRELENAVVFDSYRLSHDRFILGTSRGIAIFDGKTITGAVEIQKQLPTKRTLSVFKDSKSNVWVGTDKSGLFQFNAEKVLIQHFNQMPELKTRIRNILEDENKNLWITSEHKLLKLNIESMLFEVFDVADGVLIKNFNDGKGYTSKDGRFYFGGADGFISFMPDQLSTDDTPPPVIFTKLTRFNKKIKPLVNYDGFILNESINFAHQINLSHKDYVIGFEFAALDYALPSENKYAYRLEGFDPDWNYADANNRTATYTNLPSGQYTFQVKGSNKNGLWNEAGESIQINVSPAPWFAWWAWLAYLISAIFLIWTYVSYKAKENRKQALLLQEEVHEKTQELKIQKQRIESLLSKKNTLFSNVTHEFRTPLTLILSPLKELIRNGQTAQDIQSLQLINRNANRLLTLVEQLLQVARISDPEEVKRSDQMSGYQVQSIVDAFQHIANTKKIKLKLLQNDDARIHVTEQCMDAVLGNLISNGIKYTPSGGKVEVKAIREKSYLRLSVKDNGAGLSTIEQADIFKRFNRLPAHQNTEGLGIGLSVVEEIVNFNQGSIDVDSNVGTGCEFIVKLPVSESSDILPAHTRSTLIDQLADEPDLIDPVIENADVPLSDGFDNVLVIEDNHDMRAHIVSIIQPYYNVMGAQNGKEGVALAIEYIPDLIICDVMMPEIDGFKVSRIIRSDERTSHIPLILLTALTDKTHRIKGWREHADAYMTKPFDRDELLIQLENLLSIRDILKKKTSQNVFTPSQHPNVDQYKLAEKDQGFVDKLISIIEQDYSDPRLTLAIIAKKMAVSVRQLQRKLKALCDQNPIDLLREFRLRKASELLQKGERVSMVADNCGFNSVSYFSTCFKAQYGVSPKKYQQAFDNQSIE